MNVLSPFGDQPIAGSLPENNYIDRRVNQRLRELQLPASGTCSDREFIRRLYLDLLGILPSPQEVQEFISDASENRRQRLVERLLERPEFVDYWTYYWSDLLLISTKKLPASNVWAFSRFVRRAVAENWPWDRVARQILTAQGSNLENGAGNYFVMHKDISELTETTAVTFLGISMTCARCHNHPLEKWTQDQYWSLANVFGRLGMKNGERANEVIVQPLQEGDVLHLRRGMAMPPAPLDGPSLPPGDRQDRRMHFANWLTNPRNPYFAKALVNRVWRNFMGRGLIEAEDDLRQTNPPSNPELLQALELDFTRHGFDIKHLIRGIVNSAAYQRSAQTVAGNEKDDRFYSHYLVRRLKAEVLLDAYSQVTRAPTPFTQLESGGRDSTSPTSDYPLGTRALQLADTKVVSRFLTSFGRPERDQACSCERASEATVSQALHLNNGQTLNDKLRSNNSIAHQWIQQTTSDESAILELFRSALSREPTIKEKSAFSALLHDAAKNPTARREALEDMVWAVLSSREFVFNH